jgi:hypothetical protein
MAIDDDDPKGLKKIYQNAIDKADDLQHHFAESAKFAGYIKDRLILNKPYWDFITDYPQGNSTVDTTKMSGQLFLGSFKRNLEMIEEQIPNQAANLTKLVSSIDSFWANTAILGHVTPDFNNEKVDYHPCPFVHRENDLDRSIRLEKLDPSLAKTYRGVWEAFYGTNSDRERAALFMMRQTFDHLFDTLSPDDKVRKSPIWKEKDGPKKDLVTRTERIEYAAITHIKDESKRDMLSGSTKMIKNAYDELNKAHKRGDLDPKKAKAAIQAMDKIISDWLDAL